MTIAEFDREYKKLRNKMIGNKCNQETNSRVLEELISFENAIYDLIKQYSNLGNIKISKEIIDGIGCPKFSTCLKNAIKITKK